MNDNLAWMSSRSAWLIRLLWLMTALDVVALGSDFMEYDLLSTLKSGAFSDDIMAAAEASDLRQRIIGIGQFGLFLIAGVLTLMWIRRANKNARDAGATEMRFTPNWSIGWYFIPFATLWKPYQAMTEIWRASAKGSAAPAQTPGFFGWWWAAWVVYSFAGNIVFRLTLRAESVDDLMAASIAYMITDLISVFLNLVFMMVIKEIRDRQLAFLSVHETFA